MGGDVIVMSEMGKGSIRQLRHARGRTRPSRAWASDSIALEGAGS
jgi:hypothetical protein